MTCCNFSGCRRSQPIHIQRLDRGSTPTYAFVTRHTDQGTTAEGRPMYRAAQRHDATREVRTIISEVLNAFIDVENGVGDSPQLGDLHPYAALLTAVDHVAAKYGLQHDNIEGAWIPVPPIEVPA